MPAAPPLPKSPLIPSYQVVDASFQSPLSAPAYTRLAYNVISAYLIVWWLLSCHFYVMQLSSVFPQSICKVEHQILMDEINVKSLILIALLA